MSTEVEDKPMEFWGLEVKVGQTVKVEPKEGKVLHLSQACLGEHKKEKGTDQVLLYANKDGQKFVLANLSGEKFPHVSFDLVFEDEFELSHTWKHGSVHLAGYLTTVPKDDIDSDESDSDSEDEYLEEVNVPKLDNGKPEKKQAKPAGGDIKAAADKPKEAAVEPPKDAKEDEDDSDDDLDDDDSDEGLASPALGEEDDDSDEDEESDEDDEIEDAVPKKAEPSKKRPAEAPAKTPGSSKKVKLVTPQKTDGKKSGGHVATPHPSKQTGKATAADQAKSQQTPKSGGSFTCGSCSKTFGSEQGLQSHTKAKHA